MLRVRILILSDIHGNLAALEDAFAWGARQGAEKVWCLGDIFGFGEEGIECFDLLKERSEFILLGNHDAMALGIANDSGTSVILQSVDGDKLRSTRPDILRKLHQLNPLKELMLGGVEVFLVHAGVADPLWQFVSSSDIVEDSFALIPHKLIILGHTHKAAIAYEKDDGEIFFSESARDMDEGISLTERSRYLINPGAISGGPNFPSSCGILTLTPEGLPLRFDWR
jgi:predicted phosphodiesterase